MGKYDGSRTFTPGEGLEETVVILASDWDVEKPVSFWHPAITPSFSSPMCNAENLAIAGDSGWQRIASRVAAGLKPIGFVDSDDRAAVDQAARLVEKAGGTVRIKRCEGVYFGNLGQSGTIREAFDLDALLADYVGYLAAAPDLIPPIALELERLAPLAFTNLLDFGLVEVEWQNRRRLPETVVRCGLLLGYPPQTSAALILGDHGLPGGFTNY